MLPESEDLNPPGLKTTGMNRQPLSVAACLFVLGILLSGCAALFGWDIHAPAMLSERFSSLVPTSHTRLALLLTDDLRSWESRDRGSRFSDPQTYHIGEALSAMAIEGFQQGFEEFVFLETEPSPELLQQYGIPYLAVLDKAEFHHDKRMGDQVLGVVTLVGLYDRHLNELAVIESRGSSAAQSVFIKKGGPEVNLNAAVENNVLVTVQFLQEWIREWEGDGP